MPLSKKQLILLIVILFLIVSVGVGVYLSQNTQIFKPRADTQDGAWAQAFEFKDENGVPINCDYNVNPPVCTTNTEKIQVKVKPENLNLLQ